MSVKVKAKHSQNIRLVLTIKNHWPNSVLKPEAFVKTKFFFNLHKQFKHRTYMVQNLTENKLIYPNVLKYWDT